MASYLERVNFDRHYGTVVIESYFEAIRSGLVAGSFPTHGIIVHHLDRPLVILAAMTAYLTS